MPLPIIAIVGRPNVGKSSLFNRIVGWRHAIVSDVAGTTRDRLMADTDWEGRRFILLDTGGLETDPEGAIRAKVQEQADMAMADADVIIMMADVAEGITPADEIAANRLRTTHKPVVLAVNKVDNDNREFNTPEFYQLGMGDPPRSALITTTAFTSSWSACFPICHRWLPQTNGWTKSGAKGTMRRTCRTCLSWRNWRMRHLRRS